MPRLPFGKVLVCGALLDAWAVTSQTLGAECAEGNCPVDSEDDVALLQRASLVAMDGFAAEVQQHAQDAQGLSSGPVPASSVCVWNQGGYALEYKIQDAQTNFVVAQSSSYPNPQKQCTDLGAQAGVDRGEEFAIWVNAIAGKTVTTDRGVTFEPGSPAATFKCTGSTTMIQCNLMPPWEMGEPMDAVAVAGAAQQPLDAAAAAAAATPLGAGRWPWPQPTPAPAPLILPASQVCVWNKGGYALKYRVQDTSNSRVVAENGNYPNPQTRCTNLKWVSGVAIDQQYIIWVSAVAGNTVTTNPGIKYHPDGAKITFKCTGSTTTIKCNFESAN